MGRNYVDCVTISPLVGVGSVSIYSVATDPNGVLGANAGDFAYQVGTANRWSCTGGSVWICVGNASSGTAPAGSVVWRPGGVEDTALGIYTTWATVHAAARALADAAERETWIVPDDSIDPAGLIATIGTYDMENIRVVGPIVGPGVTAGVAVSSDIGCVFENFYLGFSGVAWTHLDPAVALCQITSQSFWRVGPDAVTSGGPVWNAAAGALAALYVQNNTELGSTSITIEALGFLAIALGSGATMLADAFTGPALSGVGIQPTGFWVYNASNFPNFLGTVFGVTNQVEGTYAGVPPASGVSTLVALNIPWRTVFGTFTLAATAGNAASIAIQVETAFGSGIYTTIATYTQVATDTLAKTYGYNFTVTNGLNYRFVKGGLVGVTETIATYNYAQRSA